MTHNSKNALIQVIRRATIVETAPVSIDGIHYIQYRFDLYHFVGDSYHINIVEEFASEETARQELYNQLEPHYSFGG